MKVKKIDYSGINLDRLISLVPRKEGKYCLFLDRMVIGQAIEYFNYDKHRTPRHFHFEGFGKEFFDISYVAYYIYSNQEARIYEDPIHGLTLCVEIKN